MNWIELGGGSGGAGGGGGAPIFIFWPLPSAPLVGVHYLWMELEVKMKLRFSFWPKAFNKQGR